MIAAVYYSKWIASYLTEAVFIVIYFRLPSIAPGPIKKRNWLKPILLLTLLSIYTNEFADWMPHPIVRVFLRIAIYYAYLRYAELAPAATSIYASIFWTIVYIVYQNVVYADYVFGSLTQSIWLTDNPYANELLALATILLIRGIYYVAIAYAVPLASMENAGALHITFVSVVCVVSAYVLSTMRHNDLGSLEMSIYYIVLNLALLILLLLFEIYRRTTRENAALQLQKMGAEALLVNIRDSQKNEYAIRSLRHDLKNHAAAVQLLLKQGEAKKAMEYLDAFLTSASVPTGTYYTGNALLDGLLKLKIPKDIKAEVTLNFSLGSFMEPFDLCVLFGNILDNAIEACESVPTEKRYLKLTGGSVANQILIRSENSCSVMTNSTFRPFVTTKRDKELHGFGIRNIKRTVDKYSGTITISTETRGVFVMSVLLPLPDDKNPQFT